jgi:hypothetical protein
MNGIPERERGGKFMSFIQAITEDLALNFGCQIMV